MSLLAFIREAERSGLGLLRDETRRKDDRKKMPNINNGAFTAARFVPISPGFPNVIIPEVNPGL